MKSQPLTTAQRRAIDQALELAVSRAAGDYERSQVIAAEVEASERRMEHLARCHLVFSSPQARRRWLAIAEEERRGERHEN